MTRWIQILSAFLALAVSAAPDRNVAIQVQVPDGSGTVYLSGDIPALGPWDPHKLPMQGAGTNRMASLQLPAGATLEFKFTLGSWETVETTASGGDTRNRSYTAPTDGNAAYFGVVEAWADKTAAKAPKQSTASASVSILSTNFAMPQLGRTRRIWIYLPPGYATSGRAYPVLYFNDGQNVFDDATSFAGEWCVDETLDQLHARGGPDCIVVAIDHGGSDRMQEYQPDFTQPNDGEGGRYVDFLVHTLKPYIDRHYRTHSDRLNTGIGGASMGGLISLYAVLKYPEVFGRALLFSTSFQVKPELFDFARAVKSPRPPTRLYFLCGQQETSDPAYVSEPQARMAALLKGNGFEARSEVSPDGQHGEQFWRREFPAAYSWLYSIGNAEIPTASRAPH